jgi:hypothetical protein
MVSRGFGGHPHNERQRIQCGQTKEERLSQGVTKSRGLRWSKVYELALDGGRVRMKDELDGTENKK